MKLKRIFLVSAIIFLVYLILVNISFGATVTVNTNVLKIRATPSSTGKVVGNLVKGNKVDVISLDGDWYKIKYSDGSKTGYVHKDYVKLNGSLSNTTTNNTTNNVVNNTISTTTNNIANNVTNNTTSNTVNNVTNNTVNNTVNNTINTPTNNKPETKDVMLSADSYMCVLPSFISSTLLKVNIDTDIEAIETINNWTRVECEGIIGWVWNKDIINFDKIVYDTEEKSEKAGETVQKKGKVTASSVNVRKTASTKATVLTSLGKNKEVTIIEKSGDWYKVKTSNGTVGYVLAEYIKII